MRDKVYFASDFHLGIPSGEASSLREAKIVAWLQMVEKDAAELYLVGDLFDFWFEHRYTVPKGFVRFLGQLAKMQDMGIRLHVFTGNHDMWMFSYLEEEIGLTMHRKPIVKEIQGKRFLIGHGDGLGPGDYRYKFLKLFFASSFCQWLFARLHPNLSFGLAQFFSGRSRLSTRKNDEVFLGEDKEWLVQYCKSYLEQEPNIDYFIFGHRHLPLELVLNGNGTKYVNLGEWLHSCTYAELQQGEVKLKKWS